MFRWTNKFTAIFLLCQLCLPFSHSIPEADIFLTIQKLRQFCISCHGVGDIRFFYSDDDLGVWNFIHTAKAPSGEIWSKAMIERLQWPSDSAPPPYEIDWMPLGAKRFELAEDLVGALPTRRFILDMLLAEEGENLVRREKQSEQ